MPLCPHRNVAAGHREDLPAYWPTGLKALVASCWAQDPSQRPSFDTVLTQLYNLQMSGEVEHMNDKRPTGNYDPTMDCGCSIM